MTVGECLKDYALETLRERFAAQGIERWRAEGMPPRVPERGDTRLFYGSQFFGLDRMEVADIEFNMIPGFREEVLEEDGSI